MSLNKQQLLNFTNITLTQKSLIYIAYFPIAEEKVMGAIQRRRGPKIVGYIRLFQSLADGLNIFSSLSEVFKSNISLFFVAVVTTGCDLLFDRKSSRQYILVSSPC